VRAAAKIGVLSVSALSLRPPSVIADCSGIGKAMELVSPAI
jgi:hypothetical protein